jgi:RHS repeat-associated protein
MPSALTSASYNADNQLTQFGSSSLTYDANGNLTSDGTNTYTWSARNQLIAISGGVSANFQYDAFGRRVSKTVAGTTQYLYDGVNPVQELSGTSVSANLLTGLGLDEYFERTDANGPANYLTDALGSTVALTGASGNTLASYTYEPFGNTSVTGGSTNSYQFTGRENDSTGLNFYRARYYGPRFQRFVSEDPIGLAGGYNLYAYAGNSPEGLNDPLGLIPKCKKPCDADFPSDDPDAAILSQLIYAEATRTGISADASSTEMAAIAYTVINRVAYLQDNPKVRLSYFGATDRSIPGVITPGQFGTVNSSSFASAATPQDINTATPAGAFDCDFLKRSISSAEAALAGTSADPFDSQGGVFGFRTTGHGGPLGSYVAFPASSQISGSGNTFYGLP